jgi:hypothetical protein
MKDAIKTPMIIKIAMRNMEVTMRGYSLKLENSWKAPKEMMSENIVPTHDFKDEQKSCLTFFT